MNKTGQPIDKQDIIDGLNSVESRAVFIKQTLTELSDSLYQRFNDGENVRALMAARAAGVDAILLGLWSHHQLDDSEYSLIAVGGYGRAGLHPCSDIDILILTESEKEPSQSLQSFLTGLWDLSLQIGHSIRTVEQCAQLAAEDLTVVTSLMEMRLLHGCQARFDQLKAATGPDKMWDAKQFYGRKWEEQIIRHKKFADTEYSLEPNIKDGPGGLRDVQVLAWLALRYIGSKNDQDIVSHNIFTEDESKSLKTSLRYIQGVRWDLHMLAGREEDRLLFDYQRLIAEKRGYQDTEEALAVEQFMQLYYQHSMNISNLNEMLMQSFEEAIWDTFSLAVPKPINERFQIRDGHLEPIIGAELFKQQPSAILEAFAILAERPQIIGPTVTCIRGLIDARHLIDEEFRASPQNKALFIRLLNASHKMSTQLRRMNQIGILALYLPQWAGIVGRMQHDLFHIYTVDAHTIQVVMNMRMLSYEGGIDRYPLASQLINQLPELDILYVAGLFHDIAKGRGGDHSTLGAVDAREFCESHGYDEHDTNLVVWLVENHLLMSSTSQRRDISDPDVIKDFALQVGNENYLKYLFVLTVCDINATNPTLWTSWRASLLRQLYNETRRALRYGLEKESQREDWVSSTRRMAMAILDQQNYTSDEVYPHWEALGEDYFLRETAADIAWHTEAIINHNGGPLVLVKDTDNRRFEGATQIFIYTPETDNLFARTTAILAQLNLSIQDARIYDATEGFSLDTYTVLNAENQPISNDSGQHLHIQSTIEEALSQHDSALSISRLVPRTLKHFNLPTNVTYSIETDQNYSVVEVISPDRSGLLATVAEVFKQEQVNLKAAKISTLGERVEDVFFVTDLNRQPITEPETLQRICDALKTQLDQQNSNES